ncbi:MAG: hypothetical protein MRT15_11725 [archaeon YNP-LCB-003-016]|uniref:hypothetical protein n=1 Tax=Candidatus Culexarchaeum yellowstonense TaxID=2928963 RepID=UPI0026F0495B|nr:hypothetical protein [Candidatus Culexarchaeum yellowstonense]MCR6693054.1 hypothetical protein [Candidatus Culexarchaeum yellowstonense]
MKLIKCVKCGGEAEYIFFGFSYCKEHYEEAIKMHNGFMKFLNALIEAFEKSREEILHERDK